MLLQCYLNVVYDSKIAALSVSALLFLHFMPAEPKQQVGIYNALLNPKSKEWKQSTTSQDAQSIEGWALNRKGSNCSFIIHNLHEFTEQPT